MRNLDIGALRSLVMIADVNGVTRAAEQLNLTQSAVSMQVKRLEQLLDVVLTRKHGRGVALTDAGEQLVSYARRLLAIHDEAYSRLTVDDFEGRVSLGVPDDLVLPFVPAVLRRCRRRLPRVDVHLVSSLTRLLERQFDHGELDVMLTTDTGPRPGAEHLLSANQHWVIAKGGQAHLKRPLPVGLCNICTAKPGVIEALDRADIAWTLLGDTNATMTVHAMVGADLVVAPVVEWLLPSGCERLPSDQLPELPQQHIHMTVTSGPNATLATELAGIVRGVFVTDAVSLAAVG